MELENRYASGRSTEYLGAGMPEEGSGTAYLMRNEEEREAEEQR
jgi:hypothetical protein